MKKVIKTSITLLISVLCIFILVGCSDDNKPFNELDKSTKESYVQSMAEKEVKNNLKSPSSASFDNLNIINTNENEFKVTGTIDAENSFGAKLRNNYTVVLDVDNEYKTEDNGGYSYRVISCDIR